MHVSLVAFSCVHALLDQLACACMLELVQVISDA